MPILPTTLRLTAREEELIACVRCTVGRVETYGANVAGAVGRYRAARDLAGLNVHLARMRAAVETIETAVDELASIAATDKGGAP